MLIQSSDTSKSLNRRGVFDLLTLLDVPSDCMEVEVLACFHLFLYTKSSFLVFDEPISTKFGWFLLENTEAAVQRCS